MPVLDESGENKFTEVTILGTDSVGADQIQDGAVGVDAINAAVAGQGLSGGGGAALDVDVDGTTIDFTGGDALEVKDDSITTAKITGFDTGTAHTNSSGLSADDTLASYTADAESGAYSGIDNTNGSAVYATVADLNALRVAYENLRALAEDLVSYNLYLISLLESRELIPS